MNTRDFVDEAAELDDLSDHEAGHVVVIQHLGGRVTSAFAIESEGRTHFELDCDPIGQIAATLAGLVVERRLGIAEEAARDHSAGDLERAWAIANSTDRPSETLARGEVRARGIVAEHWPEVEAFAERLRRKMWGLRGAELADALADVRGNPERGTADPAGVRFAAIVAGGRARRRRFDNVGSMVAAMGRRHAWRAL